MGSDPDVTSIVLTPSEDSFPAEELFAASRTAVLMAEEATGRVVAVNPAAQRLLGLRRSDLLGYDWRKAFGGSCVPPLQDAARQAVSEGVAVRVAASSSDGGAAMTATFSTFRVSGVCYLLVQIAPGDGSEDPPGTLASDVVDDLDALAVGFVVTDGALCIEFGNKAFLGIVGQPAHVDIEGQCLLRWLNLTQANLSAMHRQMLAREAGTVMTTTLCLEAGSGPAVEVISIAVPHATSAHWAFVLRELVAH
jgi:PAS domain-containing protein